MHDFKYEVSSHIERKFKCSSKIGQKFINTEQASVWAISVNNPDE
jgi:hypothetical protein